ncbi:MAG: hypothetical protein M1812_001402 [Candelaria pacifica]|nr:MAG: hypothetical protein M1812_001402 [Candelaria pacifica]
MDNKNRALDRDTRSSSRRVLSNISNPSQASSLRPSINKYDTPGLENQVSGFEEHFLSLPDRDGFLSQPTPNLKLLDSIDIPKNLSTTLKEEAVEFDKFIDFGSATSRLSPSTTADSSDFEGAHQESIDSITISFPDAVIVASLHLPQRATHQERRTGPPNFLDLQSKMFSITSQSLEMRATGGNFFMPLIQKHPALACTDQDATDAFTKLRNPELVEHLDVMTFWKDITVAQSIELGYWGDAFKTSLNEMVFKGLRAQQGGAIILQSAYHSCSSISCTGSFAAKKLQISIDDLIVRMCQIYKHRRQRTTWLQLDGIFNSAQRFVNTCDCFIDASPHEVTIQQSLNGFRAGAYNPSVSVWFPGERRDGDTQSSRLCEVEVIPQLDRLGFVDLAPMVIEGSRFQIKPYIEWSRKRREKERLSTQAVFTLEPEMSWLQWDDESASFRGYMPHWSLCNKVTLEELGPAIITHETERYASLHTLCILVKATITDPCSQGASFERVIRAKVAIKVALERCTIGQEVSDDARSDNDRYSTSEADFSDEEWNGPVDEQARQISVSSTTTVTSEDPKVRQSSEDLENLLEQNLEGSFDLPVFQLLSSRMNMASDSRVSQSQKDFLDESWDEPIDEHISRILQSATSTTPNLKPPLVQNLVLDTAAEVANNDRARQVSSSEASTATDREASTNHLGRFKPGRHCLNPANNARQPTRQPVNPPGDLKTQRATGFSEMKKLRTIRRAKKISIRNLLGNTKAEVDTLTEASSLSGSEAEAEAGPAYPTPKTSDRGYDSGCDVTIQDCSPPSRSESPSLLEDRTQAQVVFDLYEETEMRESSNLFSHMKVSVLIEAEKQRWREWKARWAIMAPVDSVTDGMLTPESGSEFDVESSSGVVDWAPFDETDLYDP